MEDTDRKDLPGSGHRIETVSVFFLYVKTKIFSKISSTLSSAARGLLTYEDDSMNLRGIISLTNRLSSQ